MAKKSKEKLCHLFLIDWWQFYSWPCQARSSKRECGSMHNMNHGGTATIIQITVYSKCTSYYDYLTLTNQGANKISSWPIRSKTIPIGNTAGNLTYQVTGVWHMMGGTMSLLASSLRIWQVCWVAIIAVATLCQIFTWNKVLVTKKQRKGTALYAFSTACELEKTSQNTYTRDRTYKGRCEALLLLPLGSCIGLYSSQLHLWENVELSDASLSERNNAHR